MTLFTLLRVGLDCFEAEPHLGIVVMILHAMSGVHLEAVEVDLLATMHRHEDAEQSAGDEEREGPVHPRVKRRVYTVQVQLRVPPPLPEELAQARLVAHVLHHRLAVVVPEAVVAAVGDAVRRLGAHVLLEPLSVEARGASQYTNEGRRCGSESGSSSRVSSVIDTCLCCSQSWRGIMAVDLDMHQAETL